MQINNEAPINELLEFLQDFAHQHQIANAERPQLTVHPKLWSELSAGTFGRFRTIENELLGTGLQGPNYQLFADDNLDDNELDVVRDRRSGTGSVDI
jgi:hypothetical protein